MEDVAEAIKMAFGVFIFVIGLTVAIRMFTLARTTSYAVLGWKDKSSDYVEDYEQAGNNIASEYRIVGLETIIPTLYKYSKENYVIRFRKASSSALGIDGSDNNISDVDITFNKSYFLQIYTSSLENSVFLSDPFGSDSIISKEYPTAARYFKKYNDHLSDANRKAFVESELNLNQEIARKEPWTSSTTGQNNTVTAFISHLLTGSSYKYEKKGVEYTMNFPQGALLSNWNYKRFQERVGKYEEYKEADEEDDHNKTTTKTVITYIMIN